MRLEIDPKNVNPRELKGRVGEHLRHRVEKLERMLESFPPDAVRLHLSLEHFSATGQYRASATLFLPPADLHAEEESPLLLSAVNAALDDLVKQWERLKGKLRREHELRHRARS